MSEEERQRQIDFILNSLAQLSAKVDSMADIQRADAVRIGRLEEALVMLTQLSARVVDRMDEHQARISGIEDAIVKLTRLVERTNGGA